MLYALLDFPDERLSSVELPRELTLGQPPGFSKLAQGLLPHSDLPMATMLP